jgi:conjugal transfer pilus assembly protein TraF
VIAISVDADAFDTDLSGRGTVAEFPNAEVNNGLFEFWGLKVLPALIAINPQAKEAIPIAYGLTSLDEMENRVMMLLGARS